MSNKLTPEELAKYDEVVFVTGDHGSAKFKINHKSHEVFVKAGPEESLAWKHTNGSYNDIMRKLNRPEVDHKVANVAHHDPIEGFKMESAPKREDVVATYPEHQGSAERFIEGKENKE